ncbi:hypothetical protein FQN52_005899 [Onygenales sp. PD_12]|nr:hypothetical protein FQN52_005899 [Onygenales sp. PD_12]
MNAVASRSSDSAPMAYNGDPYRGIVPSRQSSPVYPMPVQQPRSAPRPPPSTIAYGTGSGGPNNYSNSSTPGIYSPTSGSFVFRSFKPVHSAPKELAPFIPFAKPLPQEVYDCILSHLQFSHSAPNSEGCMTCFMRDLYSLALTSRAWEKAVRVRLYNKIYIQGNDSPGQLKKYKWKRGSRLRLLRRTLRERKLLANAVLEIRVPDLESATGLNGKQSITLQEYRDLVASVVMVCPNLERLLGLSLPYTHEFDRLTHALSTRKKLKEHAWVIGENPEISERARTQSSSLLDNGQVYQFLNYHASWSHLETLMLHSLNSNGVLEHGVFLRMFNLLPSLRHLSISDFNSEDFTDRTLLFLPPLISLRLENLPGLTENGLARYTSRPEARSLKSLTLIEQNISSLLIISKIFASLRQLERFSIVQTKTVPRLTDGGMVFQPLLASSALRHLHWDVACSDPNGGLSESASFPSRSSLSKYNTANSHLAQSILNSGFPCLESLRAPLDIDPLGALQAVCRPTRNGQIMHPQDRYSLPRSSHGSISKRPMALPSGNNLTSARIRGQTLIDLAVKDHENAIKVVVTDHSGGFTLPTTPTLPTLSDTSLSDPSSEIDDRYDILGPLKQKGLTTPTAMPKPKPNYGITVHEFTLPACMGRVYRCSPSTTNPITNTDTKPATTPPRFILTPDIPGSDTDGGLLNWRHYLSANQTLTFIAASPASALGRINTGSSVADDSVAAGSPPPTTSRFAWGSSSSNSNSNSNINRTTSSNGKSSRPLSPRTPTSPTMSMMTTMGAGTTGGGGGVGGSGQPFWVKETCTGSWNQGHKLGKEWWAHVERERPVVGVSADRVRLRQLF